MRLKAPPKVKNYMSAPVIVVKPSDTLAHARNLMLRHKVNRLVVVEEKRIAGVLTSTDFLRILRYPELARKAFDELLVRDVMTEDVITVEENASVREAASLMVDNAISTLPVVNETTGELVGIITKADLTRAYAEVCRGEVAVGDVMDRSPPTVTPLHSLYRVLEAMEEKPYYKVVVVEGKSPVGVIAKRDVIFLELPQAPLEASHVKRGAVLPKGRIASYRIYLIPLAMDLMSSPPITTAAERDLGEAARLMVERGIGCLPVVNDANALVGIVTKNEVVSMLASR